MSRYVPISQSTHQSAGWKLISDFSFAKGDALAPVSVVEISQLLPRYPLAFYRANEHSPLQLVTIQGLLPGQNLYLTSSGKWLGGYIPAVYRGYPFRMIAVQGTEKLALCIDEDSENFKAAVDENSEALFKANGELSGLSVKMKEFLLSQQIQRSKTEALAALLDEYGVIQPWHIRIDGLSETVMQHGSLFHINEQILKSLDAEKLKVLNLKGALSIAYAQMLSESRIQDLVRLFNLQTHHAKQKQDASTLNLDQVFGEEEELFRF